MPVDKQQFTNWISGAYDLEVAGLQSLEDHAKESGNYPELSDKLLEHAKKTLLHAETMKKCLQKLGGSVSAVREGMATASAILQTAKDDLASDLVLKNLLSDIGSERHEVAYYQMLIAAAEEFGEQEILNICKDILREEEEMATWLESQLPDTVQKFLRDQV